MIEMLKFYKKNIIQFKYKFKCNVNKIRKATLRLYLEKKKKEIL